MKPFLQEVAADLVAHLATGYNIVPSFLTIKGLLLIYKSIWQISLKTFFQPVVFYGAGIFCKVDQLPDR